MYAVKVTKSTSVKRAPNANSDSVCSAYKDEVLTIVDEENGFGKINGAGWISLGCVKECNAPSRPCYSFLNVK